MANIILYYKLCTYTTKTNLFLQLIFNNTCRYVLCMYKLIFKLIIHHIILSFLLLCKSYMNFIIIIDTNEMYNSLKYVNI